MILSLREQLVRDEGGYQAFVYNDSVGVPTIGVGRNISKTGEGLSIYEQDLMLNNDISSKTIEVLKAIPWSGVLDAIRFEVLVNMAFNLGIGSSASGKGLLGFPKFLAALQRADYHTAAKEMLDSTWAKQVGARATRLSQQIVLGIRQ